MPKYRFSGHETFPCRYAWLPKAVSAIGHSPNIFSREDQAIVELGVGKNMVRAIRFWLQATCMAEPSENGGYKATQFGDLILGENGLDRYLEDRCTLWLLHWKLSTHVEEPLFAWDYLINRWSDPEIIRAEVIKTFDREAKRLEKELSRVTLEQHFDVFLHTYIPTRGRKGDIQEDNLDCPLVEIELLERIGDKPSTAVEGRHEPVYAFRREPKSDITPELFVYCLFDYWNRRKRNETTLTFRDISVAHGSIGQVLKLPEWDIRERLEKLKEESDGLFEYEETASLQRIICTSRKNISEKDLLSRIYKHNEIVTSVVPKVSTQNNRMHKKNSSLRSRV